MKTKSADTKRVKERHGGLLRPETGKRGAGQLVRVAVPALLLVAIAVTVTLLARRSTEYRFNDVAGQYYGGQKFSIPEGTRMYREGKESTKLAGGALDRETDALPIYYENKQMVVLPQDMVYYAPRDNTCLRVKHFSELTYNSLGATMPALRRVQAVRLHGNGHCCRRICRQASCTTERIYIYSSNR